MTTQKILITGGSGFIGTHYMDWCIAKGIDVINLDIKAPQRDEHLKHWVECNILNYEKLKTIFTSSQPTHIVHLAAQTSTECKTLDDYKDNTIGTENILDVTKITSSIARIIITSSQHVRKPGSGLPQHDQDFNPHGLYGESKMIAEQLTRKAHLECVWTIIRPTTIWGPYHTNMAQVLWKLMSKGWYVHPQNDPVIRSYGYVKNVVWGIENMLNAPSNMVDKRVFYLGDDPIKQSEWIDSFSMALSGRKTTKIPKEWIYFLARIGDILEKIGVRFPMNSPRYFNLTTTNPVPIDSVIKQFGTPPYSLEQGIAESVSWLNNKNSVLD